MKIAIRRGHQRTGSDLGSVGILREIDVAEDYYIEVIKQLKNLGHEVLDVTPPEAHRSTSESLNYGTSKANNWKADLYVSCHANNFYNRYEGALGSQVLYYKYSDKSREYAEKIHKELVKLGFRSRGAKADPKSSAELINTNMPAVIVEAFFVEALEDISIWKKVGAEEVAAAIVKGIVGE